MVDITVLAAIGLADGLFLLWWGGSKTVNYAAQVAYLFGISGFFIGFFFASISTGIPELSIAMSSLWYGTTGISVGDIIGSNLADIALVLGFPSFFYGLIRVPRSEKRNILLSLGMTGMIMAFIFLTPTLTPWHGLALVLFYVGAMVYFWQTRHGQKIAAGHEALSRSGLEGEKYLTSKFGTVIKLIASMVLVLIAAQLCVHSAIILANHFRVSMAAIGATIIAIGASLPELILRITAVRRRQYSMALGNAIGSVLEQGGLILGLLALGSKTPLSITPARHIIPFMLIAYLVVLYGIWRRNKINRIEGFLLLLVYVSFLAYELSRIYW